MDGPTRLLLNVERTHLLPQGLTAGMLLSYGVTRSNPAFAFGQFSSHGWPWYFPAALLVKTPLGLLSLWAGAVRLWWKGGNRQLSGIALAAIVIFAAAVASPLNIGVRHVLPVTVLLAVLTARQYGNHLSRPGVRRFVGVSFAVLVGESLLGLSDPISFFNLPARAIGPDKLLADSNLDWGQDLKRLAEWRKQHPTGTLYLAYWGTADPRSYGFAGPFLPDTWTFASVERPQPHAGAMVAVSTTFLQGVSGGQVLPGYNKLRQRPPIARIGRSIAVFPYDDASAR